MMLHLKITHKIDLELSVALVLWLESYKMRGNGGLIEQYTNEFAIPLHHYWIEERKHTYNTIYEHVSEKECIESEDNYLDTELIWDLLVDEFKDVGDDFVKV